MVRAMTRAMTRECVARGRLVLALSFIAALAAACAGPPRDATPETPVASGPAGGAVAGQGEYKIGNPYKVAGVWYYPAADPVYDEIGIASWYGRKFHGLRTANGDIYDMNAMTAAHKTLPMPSLVRVTNLENGRSIVVTVNDRGPFVAGRIIDLSRRAARHLGFQNKGTARVRVQAATDPQTRPVGATATAMAGESTPDTRRVVGEARRAASLAGVLPPGGGFVAMVGDMLIGSAQAAAPPADQPSSDLAPSVYYVQAGAFGDPDNARRASARLAAVGATRVTRAFVDGRELHRVQLGPVADIEAARLLLRRVHDAGHPEARVIAECAPSAEGGATRWRAISAPGELPGDICM